MARITQYCVIPVAALICTAGFSNRSLATEDCVIPYSAFEAVKPHFDLESCPADLASEEEGFCRISLENGGATIYEFRYASDDACLTAVRPARNEDYIKRD
jgi:hypothetical protein